jgi:beta-glucanase (GH16 family)
MKRALSLTVFMALGAWVGCAVDRSGLQTQAAPSGGVGESASPIGGAAAVAGAPDSGESSIGVPGDAGTPGSTAEVASGGALGSGGTGGSAPYLDFGGMPSGGTSATDASQGSGGAPTGGGTGGSAPYLDFGGAPTGGDTFTTDVSQGSGGAPTGGGTSATDAGAEDAPRGGGTSGGDAPAGSADAYGGSRLSGRDSGSGSSDGGRIDATLSSDAGLDSGSSPNWHLVWWDDFDLGLNVGADTTRWNVATSEPGTVNGELQKYTARPQNIFHDGQGNLVLRGLHDSWRSNGTTYPYTSGRLQTDGKFQFKFGRVEVRAKLPAGQGAFPAILLMGTTGNWPQCGEIAMMEQLGQDKSWLYCATYSGTSSDIKQNVTFDNSTTLSSDFHTYALEWYPDHMVFFIDNQQVARSNVDTASPFYTGTFYLILDVAIGGNMGGTVDDTGGFPMDMVLDYVHVYTQQ